MHTILQTIGFKGSESLTALPFGAKADVCQHPPVPRSVAAVRGSVLLVVLVVIAMLTLAAYTFCDRMLQHRRGTWVHGRGVQAVQLAESGRELVALFLDQDWESLQYAGGIYDNPDRLRGVLVVDDDVAKGRGRFTVIAPVLEDGLIGNVRFGLEDESARIHVNTLLEAEKKKAGSGRGMLMTLPGMTDEIADAVLDWIDEDDEPRQFGAEADYYAGLDPPYVPRNGPLLSVEELLLVRGVTADLVYGADLNRNGLLDAQEANSEVLATIDTTDSELLRGWAGDLTLFSAERNVRPDGSARIDLNQSDLKTLHAELTEAFDDDTATFIVAYRQYGDGQNEQQGGTSGGSAGGRSGRSTGGASAGSSTTQPRRPTEGNRQPVKQSGGSGSTTGPRAPMTQVLKPAQRQAGSAQSGKIDFSKEGSVKLETVLDLIGARVQIPGPNPNQPPTAMESPFAGESDAMAKYLPDLMENTTTDASMIIRGRININQASRAVLSGIPGMREETVSHILASRDMDVPLERSERLQPTWILAEGIVTLDEMKQLLPHVNAGGSAFRAQIVGYFGETGPVARIETVLSATTSPPRLLLWRDISHLGHGYAMEILGAE